LGPSGPRSASYVACWWGGLGGTWLCNCHVIISPQLWTDMSPSRTGPLTLRWWHHSIYVAWPSTTYGILVFICHCLPLSIHFSSIWADHLQTKHTLSWSLWSLAIIHRSHNLSPTCGTYHCGGNVENGVEETDNSDPKRDKVPFGDNRGATLGKLYLRSLIQFGLMYPPFWFSMLEFKKAILILLEGKTLKITVSGCFVISSELSHMISTLDSTACNMEGHVKLINRLSSPSNQLIHHISHLSKEQTLAKPNVSCFICIWVHSFTAFNLHLCKKGSHGVKGPSEVSTQK